MAALEATSNGLPLILSDIPSHQAILDYGIGSGILVSSIRPRVDDIVKFVSNFSGRKRARKLHLSQNFSWKSVVKTYLSLLGI